MIDTGAVAAYDARMTTTPVERVAPTSKKQSMVIRLRKTSTGYLVTVYWPGELEDMFYVEDGQRPREIIASILKLAKPESSHLLSKLPTL